MTIAHDAHPHDDDTLEALEAGVVRLEAPHACTEGAVYIGHLVEDPGSGDEVEVIEAVPCSRCTDSR